MLPAPPSEGDRLYHWLVPGVFIVRIIDLQGAYLEHRPPKGWEQRNGPVMMEHLVRDFTRTQDVRQ